MQPNKTIVPPDFGVIHPDVLDRKSAFEFADRHSKIAMQHAAAGQTDAAVHHHAQAQAYSNFLKAPTMKKTEKIVGGIADGKSVKDIAAHHKVDLALVDKQFKMGQKVELEHTTDQAKADEIARDHLWEDPKYYSKLAVMEGKVDKCEDKKKKIIEAERRRQMDTPLMTQPADEPYSAKVENPVAGLEPLKKPIAKSMAEEWSLLKAKISANDAFLSVDDIIGDEPKDEGGDAEAQGAEQPQPQGDDQSQDNPLSPEEESQLDQHAKENPEATQGDQPADQSQGQEPQGAPDMDQIAEMMRQEGYSDSEIAHVLHGHVPAVPTAEDHAAVNEQAQGEQDRFLAQREADAKHGHMTKLQELEAKKKEAELQSMDPESDKEHSKRLKDLEYEKAKKKLESEDHDGEREHKKHLRELELRAKQAEIDSRLDDYDKRHKARMADLEYDKARRESAEVDPTNAMKAQQLKFEMEMDKMQKQFEMEMDKKEREMELKYKEKELQLNLQLKAEAAKIKSALQEEQMHADHEVNMQVKEHQAKHKIAESKKAPVQEPSKKVDK